MLQLEHMARPPRTGRAGPTRIRPGRPDRPLGLRTGRREGGPGQPSAAGRAARGPQTMAWPGAPPDHGMAGRRTTRAGRGTREPEAQRGAEAERDEWRARPGGSGPGYGMDDLS